MIGTAVYEGPAAVARAFVDFFVGIVFVVLPYLTSVFVTYKGWKLIGNRSALGWNAFCIFVMLSAFISGIIGFSQMGRRSRF